jgi:hypothetical protein
MLDVVFFMDFFDPSLLSDRAIDPFRRSQHKNTKDLFLMFVPTIIYSVSSSVFAYFVDFRGITEVFVSLFGPQKPGRLHFCQFSLACFFDRLRSAHVP